MNKFLSFLESKLGPVAEKISSNRYIQAINAGFYISMPFILVGSLFLLICNIPINGYTEFMASVFGENWTNYLLKVNDATMSIMSVFVIIGLSNNLAKYYKIEQVSSVAASFVAFIIVTPIVDGNLGLANFGASSIFLCILVSIVTVEIIRFVRDRGWVIKMPSMVPQPVQESFSALIPVFVVAFVFNLVRIGFELTSFGSLGNFISTIFQYPLMALTGTLPAMILISLLECVLWFFGIHGSNITGSAVNPMLTALTLENAEATLAGVAPTHIINSQFWNNFLHLGGAGATIGLVICMLIFARSKQYKSVGKLTLIPSIFQINEPVLFGFPVIYNPLMFIPLIVGPIINAIICYAAFATGLVPIINGVNLTWTIPPVVSGFILCGWRGAVLQVLLIVINTLVWFPFFKVQDHTAYLQEEGE